MQRLMKNTLRSSRWNLFLVLILILELVIFGQMNDRFLRVDTLLNSFDNFAGIAIIAFFVTFVIITGGIDISGGSIVGLASVITGILYQVAGWNISLAAAAAIIASGLCGLLNGLLIAYVGVQAMIITLGSMLLFKGLAILLFGLSGVSVAEGISKFPTEFTDLAHIKLFGVIPMYLAVFAVMLLISYLLLHRTRYGRYIYLIGINPNTARYSGINTKRIIASTYVLSGFAAGISGVLLTSYLWSARAEFGETYLMPMLTAVVLGGTLITGGKGGVIGTALASIIVGFLQLGLQLGGVQSQYTGLAVGLLLIVSVVVLGVSGMNLRIKGVLNVKKDRGGNQNA